MHVCKEEKEKRTFLDQEQVEPQQMKKEEEEELCCSQQEEQLFLKQEIKSECDEIVAIQFDDLSENNICKEETDDEQLLWTQERSFSLDEEEPDPPQIKEEWEEVCIGEEEEQFELKQGPDDVMFTECDQENVNSEPEPRESPFLEENTQNRNNDAVTVQLGPPLDESSLRCETCGKVFTRRRNLNVHMKIHTGERPFQCEICEKGFIRRCQLQVHMRSHTGERPFTCEICEKGFTQSGQLQVHLRTHTGEKPFTCEICHKCFTKSFHLKVHMRTHTGERPYTCEICGKSYAQSSYLTVHMKTHASDRCHPCKICGKSYTQSSYLTVHIKKAHT
ncbi:zinc finger protein 239 isoform X2 [Oryzias melastigma]|nr:zinc finger protein 239 isoform X2 [Oryzias melastigma]